MAQHANQERHLGFVVEPELTRRLVRLAMRDHRTKSQMARILLDGAIEEKEQALGLGPIEDDPQYGPEAKQ